jgi:lipid II:glycine glycyltransferase (peptidoglycan interpeptide bridge formation enzyme)
LKELYPDRIKLFAAYKGEILTAGVLVFLLNERVINCFYIAHDDRYQHMRPLNLIFGYMMEWGRKNSFSYLDWGISTEGKGSSVNTGLFRFKESYGGHGVLRECYLYAVNNNK